MNGTGLVAGDTLGAIIPTQQTISPDAMARMQTMRSAYLASLTRLNGKVTLVDRENYNFYTVEGTFDPPLSQLPPEMGGGTNIRVQCGYDLPIKRDHLISAVGRIESDPRTGSIFRVTSHPLVMFPTNKDAVVWNLVDALKGTGFGTVKGGVFFDKNALECGGPEQVFAYLNYLSYHYEKTTDFIFVRKVMSHGLDIEQGKKLLKWWYYNVNIGRLKLMGLTSEEIENSRMKPDDLFQKVISEPMQIPSLAPERAMTLYESLGKPCSDTEKYKGEIIRLIHRFVTKYGWSGVPTSYLLWKFPQIEAVIDAMKADHDLVGDLRTIYFRKDFEAEAKCASLIVDLLKKPVTPFYDCPPEQVKFKKVNLNPQQKEAVLGSLSENISVITGGAGTGKTTIIAEIIYHLEQQRLPYQLVSFTGKAVARMKEVIGNNSPSTFHRMIFKVNVTAAEKFAYLIVDEASMVTVELFMDFYAKFGAANGFHYKIIFVGDPHQLPPIPSCGPGMLFAEVIGSGCVKVFTLITNHRSDITGEGVVDGIKVNAQALIEKVLSDPEDDIYAEYFEGTSEYQFHQTDNFMAIEGGGIEDIMAIIELLRMSDPSAKPQDIKVICPYRHRKDVASGSTQHHIQELNICCQRIFETGNEKFFMDNKGFKWRVDDVVKVIKNNYSEGLEKMNGEEGIIIDILDPGQEIPAGTVKWMQGVSAERAKEDIKHNRIVIRFYDGMEVVYVARYPGRGEAYHPRTLNALIHAYALTVHESQGGEWQYVLGYLPPEPPSSVLAVPTGKEETDEKETDEKRYGGNFLTYQLVYVLLTRARKGLFLVGDIQTLQKSATQRPARRWDRLGERIKNGIEEMLKVTSMQGLIPVING
jgi:hypothetical protein